MRLVCDCKNKRFLLVNEDGDTDEQAMSALVAMTLKGCTSMGVISPEALEHGGLAAFDKVSSSTNEPDEQKEQENGSYAIDNWPKAHA